MSKASEKNTDIEDHPLLEEYESSGDNEGYDYQEQFLVHFCLILRRMCGNFFAGYEVKAVPKFDDVVCDFTFDTQNILAMIQCKFVSNKNRQLNWDCLFPKPQDKYKRGMKKKFNLRQYIGEIKEVMQKFGKSVKKFIIITNLELDESNLHMIPEDNKGIKKLFEGIGKDTKIQRFGEKSYKLFETLLGGSEVKGVKVLIDYVMQNLIIVTNSPDVNGLKELNTEILTEEFKVANKKSLHNFVTLNISDFCKPFEIEIKLK